MSIVLLGSTSGSCTLQEQAVAGTTTLTLPTFNGTVGLLVSGTAVTSTSGTSIDFTGIPAGVRRITVILNGVSVSGTSNLLIQLGDAGGIENTSYTSVTTRIGGAGGVSQTSTAGFVLTDSLAAVNIYQGTAIFCNISGNNWVLAGSLSASSGGNTSVFNGSKATSDTLTQVRITTVNGTDTFDAGSINILYE